MMKSIIAAALIVVLAIPAGAQRASNEDAWRTFVSKLEPNAFVKIKLANGKSLRGHVVRADADAVHVNPRTRVAVPLRQLSYSEIVSIETQKEPKWNPASKVLLGVGIGVGVLYVLAVAAVAGLYGWS